MSETAVSMEPMELGFRMRGPRYSAELGATGWKYRRQSRRSGDDAVFEYQLERIAAGGSVLYDRPSSTAAQPHQVSGTAIAFTRAPGIVEVYRARQRGLEQLFEIAAPPPSGDLRITGKVTTPLHGRREERFGVVFSSMVGSRRVDRLVYSNPVAIDAARRRFRGTAAIAGDRLSIEFTATQLGRMQFPITIDPIVGDGIQIAATASAPSAVFSAAREEYAVVYENGTDQEGNDIIVERLDRDGNTLGALNLSAALVQGHDPDIAYSEDSDRYAIVFARRGPNVCAVGESLILLVILDGECQPLEWFIMNNESQFARCFREPKVFTYPDADPPDEEYGAFTIVWADSSGSERRIVAERVMTDGYPFAAYDDVVLVEETSTADYHDLALAYSPDLHRFCLTYSDPGLVAMVVDANLGLIRGQVGLLGEKSSVTWASPYFQAVSAEGPYDLTTGNYEREVILSTLDGDGALLSAIPITSGDSDQADPAIHYNPLAGEMLVAWLEFPFRFWDPEARWLLVQDEGIPFCDVWPPYDYTPRVMAQAFSPMGQPNGPPFELHWDAAGYYPDDQGWRSEAAMPTIAKGIEPGRFLPIWQEAKWVRCTFDPMDYFSPDLLVRNELLARLVEAGGANHAPVADDQSVSTSQSVPLQVPLTGRDFENDPLTFRITRQPLNGTLSGSPPSVVYTPHWSLVGNDSFEFCANDSWEDSPAATVQIAVAAGVDTDGDGMVDAEEAQWGTNPNNPDSDGDGLSDGAETHTHLTNPLLADTDGDGLSDSDEIQRGTNPRQGDTDGDGLSDGAEVQVHGTDPLKADTDADGLSDSQEIQVHGTNPVWFDTDGDRIPDGMEVDAGLNPLAANSATADTDGDGLTDLDEVTFGTKLNNTDSDGDGASDSAETSVWADPNDPSDAGVPPPPDELVELELLITDPRYGTPFLLGGPWWWPGSWDPEPWRERYILKVGSITHLGEYGGPNANPRRVYKFRKGRSYPVAIEHAGTFVPGVQADYDYYAGIFYPNSTGSPMLHDPHGILWGHLYNENLIPRLPFLAQDRGAILGLPVLQFLNNQNQLIPTTSALAISNFLTTSSLPVTTGFDATSVDPDNFRIELEGATETADPFKFTTWIRVNGKSYEVHRNGSKWRTPFLRLVSDDVDDQVELFQTIKTSLGDRIQCQYPDVPGVSPMADLPVGLWNAPRTNENAILRLYLKIRIAYLDNDSDGTRDPGEEVTTLQAVQGEITEARERWAQCGIKIEVPEISYFHLTSAALGATTLLSGATVTSIIGVDPTNRYGMGKGFREAVLASPPAGGQFVTVYFVPRWNARAKAFNPLGIKLTDDLRKLKGAIGNEGQDQAFANTVFIGVFPLVRHFVLAHELGHILTNMTDSTQSLKVLFPTDFPMPEDNTVDAAKRLSAGEAGSDPPNKGHYHVKELHGINLLDPTTGIEIRPDEFSVPDFARHPRIATDPTDIGNTVLQQ